MAALDDALRAGRGEEVSRVPAAGSVPASLGKRLLARVIDLVAALVLGGGLLLGGLVGQYRAGEPALSALTVVGAVLLGGHALVQWWLLATRGYTLGRVLTGLRVLTADEGRPIGLGRALVRELVVAAGWLLPVVGVVLLGTSAARDRTGRRRGWQDRAAGDVVFDVHVGVDPVQELPTPRQATERLQSVLGDARRRHRDAPRRVASGSGPAAPPAPAGGIMAVEGVPAPDPAREADPAPAKAEADQREVAPMVERPTPQQPAGPRVVPRAPYEQRSSASYRALDDDVERTRLRQARTKVAYAPTRAQTRPRATLLLWDNRVVVLEGTALVGRNPSPREGEALPVQVIAVVDRGRSVSKTHLAIGVDADGVWLKDRNSTNGTVVTLEDGQQILCAPEQKVRVPVGASVAFGDYWLTVAG